MKAIALIPGTAGVSLTNVEEPEISAPDEVKIKIMQVGICGTDREEVRGGRAAAPAGKNQLIIGHEMFGQVVAVGAAVSAVVPGDYAVFTVRRGCNECLACLNNRSDLCYTGKYTERGIKGADGFQAEYVVDKENYLIKVPERIKNIGVLTEPMSVASKAIDEAVTIQLARLKSIIPGENWLEGKKALIAGIGAIGLMAAFALRLKGAEVLGMDIVDEESLRPQLLKQIGGLYIDSRKVSPENLEQSFGECDFIFEATGIAKLQVELIDALAINGIYVVTGIPSGKRPETIMAGRLMQQMVLKNQIILGSVNASPAHYQIAVQNLDASLERWSDTVQNIITQKIPFTRFAEAFDHHDANEIKVVVDWTGQQPSG